jgi:3-vinyl bacteriochlorophyllide hydratase
MRPDQPRPDQLRKDCAMISSVLDRLMAAFDGSPWAMSSGRDCLHARGDSHRSQPLYTPEQRRRRDSTYWTLVQGILAPIQFLVFMASAVLVVRFLATGEDYALATASVVAKTLLLYAIMVTGAIWEKVVFGRYLFAFYWEDVFSMLVLALHTAYLTALVGGYGDPEFQMTLALAAYATYVVNATQFVLKLRAARRDEQRWKGRAPVGGPIGSF